MDIDNHIPIANYIFVTITAGVLAYVTAMSENVDKSYEMPPEYADEKEDMSETTVDSQNEDNNNTFISSFGTALAGFGAGVAATDTDANEVSGEDEEGREDERGEEVTTLYNSDAVENEELNKEREDEREKRSEVGGEEEIPMEKIPIKGGTKHNKSSKKTKSNVKRKTSSNKKRKTK